VPRRLFVLTSIAVVTVVAAASCGSSAGNPAGQATQPVTTTRPSAPARTFTSKRYRFRVTLPQGWSGADALVSWSGKQLEGLASPAFARLTDPYTGRTFVAAAARVAKGTELAEWRAAMVRATPAVCPNPSPVEKTTLGGEPALAWTHTCTDGYHVNKLATLHGRRGYIIFLASQIANDDAEDRRIFESIRSSFRFTR
jgi:hypothetical protein